MVWIHNWNPVLVQIGPLGIRWYSLMYVAGFLLTLYCLRRAARAGHIRMSDEDIDVLLTGCVFGLIVGARLFAVVFWEPRYYVKHLWEVLAVWHGGLSFHGGAMGIIIAMWWFCRKRNISFLQLGDIMIVPLALGQALGRFGNFMNSELFGPPTMLWLGINFLGESDAFGNLIFRHPTMLYEAGYNIIIFCILSLLNKKERAPGFILGNFFVSYSIFQSLTEFIRVEDVFDGPLTMGQTLNIPVFIAGVYLLLKKRRGKI